MCGHSCTRGLRVTNFYGNFFIRGTDLLALPNVTEDTAFNVELAHEEVLTPGTVIGIQAALLYTTSSGERRINVHTMAAPVSQLLTDLFKKVCAAGCVSPDCTDCADGTLPAYPHRWT